MPTMGSVPRSEVMTGATVEESWSSFVPRDGGAEEPIVEYDRNKAIPNAVQRTLEIRNKRVQERMEQAPAAMSTQIPPLGKPQPAPLPATKYFFIYKDNTFTYLGKSEDDLIRFTKDLSGRFFREWVKKTFKIENADNVVCYDGKLTVNEMMDLWT